MLASAPVGVLSRYLLVRFVAAFLGVLVALSILVGVIELLADFGDVITSSKGFLEAWIVLILRIPHKHLPILIPASAFAAAYLSVGTAARSYEILAMKAGGISPLRVLVPLLLAAVVISGFALLLNETVAVQAREASRRHDGDDGGVSFRRGSFWYHKGHTIYNVRDADPAARALLDIAIFELDDRGRLLRTIQAARATIGEGGRWHLVDAVLRGFDPDDASAPSHYERLADAEIDLPDETALLDVNVSALSIAELREYGAQQEPGDTESLRAEALLHERVAEPLASLVFVVLALPLALRVERTRSLAVPALQGVAAIFLFYMVREYGRTLATQGVTSAAGTPWAIVATFLCAGAWQIWRTPR
ncbi:MAG: lptG [Deltaproteobacteria bacterium]|nr:lptG [Deltaproteobacteria bacterium]